MKRRPVNRRTTLLERLLLERSVGRGGAPSIAMNMWNFLMDNGPSTVNDIERGLGSRYANRPTIKSYLDAGLITQQGDRYVANPNYNWDDVGVIARDPAQSFQQARANGEIELDNAEETQSEEPAEQPSRRGRTPREPRQRAVKQNLFSKKIEEVRAAVEAGQDVNQKNAMARTPLLVALANGAWDIAKYLLDHGANPNVRTKSQESALGLAIAPKSGSPDAETIRKLISAGADVSANINRRYVLPITAAQEDANFPVELYSSLINQAVIDSGATGLSRFFKWIVRRDAPESVKKEYIDKVLDLWRRSPRSVSSLIWDTGRAVDYTLGSGNTMVFDSLIEKDIIPIVSSRWANAYERGVKAHVYDGIKKALEKGVKPLDFVTLLNTARDLERSLNRPDGDLSGLLLTDDSIKSMPANDVVSLLSQAVRNRDTKLIDKLRARKLTGDNLNDVLHIAGEPNTQNDTNIMRSLLRCIDASRVGTDASNYTLTYLLGKNNPYLVDFIIDKVKPERLIYALRDYSHMIGRLSEETLEKLKKVGISPSQIVRGDANTSAYEMNKKQLINALSPEEDAWRYVDDSLKRFPDLLTDPDVIDAINDPKNEGGYCVGQLKRRLAELPKDVYDF